MFIFAVKTSRQKDLPSSSVETYSTSAFTGDDNSFGHYDSGFGYSISEENDFDHSSYHLPDHSSGCVNPATGLPMAADDCSGIDVGGNAFGFSSGTDDFLSDSRIGHICGGIDSCDSMWG